MKIIFVLMVSGFFWVNLLHGATITVNTNNFEINESVAFYGTGFQVNEIVNIEVHPDIEGAANTFNWSITADGFGGFESYWTIPSDDFLGISYTVSAVGQSSGLEASATFTGGNTRLTILFEFSNPICPDTLTLNDSIVVCAKLTQACAEQEEPLPGRQILFFLNFGNCGVNMGQTAFDSGTTNSEGVACIVVHSVDTLITSTENLYVRTKFLGENKPGPDDPGNSACTINDLVNLSASNNCIPIETVQDCPSDSTFEQSLLGSIDIYSMKTGDLDRNNFTDIVYCGTSTTPGLYVLLALDENNFSAPTQCLDIHSAALSIDFINSDSLPDIVAKTSDSIYILLNGGGGTLCDSWTNLIPTISGEKFSVGQSAADSDIPIVITGYFNNDSYLDMFVGPSTVFFGDGTGNLSSSNLILIAASSAATADFNHDGWQDLLAVEIDSAFLLLNDGDGAFAISASLYVDTGYISVPVDIAVGDLDEDCHIDFIVPSPNVDSSGLSVLHIGFGDGLGQLDQTATINIDGVVQDVLIVDVDRDNIQDIVASNGTKQRVEIYHGNGDRTFDPMEYFSISSAGDAPFSLASADFDRDGQPDFISGSYDNGNLLLSSNNIEDLPVLPDEMAVTSLTNTTMRIIDPYDYQISDQTQTIAGGDIWRIDVNGDDFLDEQVLDYNLLTGEYELTFYLRPEYDDGTTQPLTSSVRIDGSQQATIFDNYNYPSNKGNGSYSPGCYPDSIKFIYLIGEDSSLYYPFNGIQTNSSQPAFFWEGLLPEGGTKSIEKVHLQVDRTLDFLDPIINDSDLASASFTPCSTLFKIDSVYYWHVRWFDGVSWSDFSNTFAVYIGGNCCFGNRGDVNTDGMNANILDLSFMVNYIFRSGDCAQCPEEADISVDGNLNILDLNYLIAFIFRSGPPPGPCN